MNKVIIGKMLIGLSIILGIYYLILDLWFRHASYQDFGMITLGGLYAFFGLRHKLRWWVHECAIVYSGLCIFGVVIYLMYSKHRIDLARTVALVGCTISWLLIFQFARLSRNQAKT